VATALLLIMLGLAIVFRTVRGDLPAGLLAAMGQGPSSPESSGGDSNGKDESWGEKTFPKTWERLEQGRP
jgi:hypothetical protein